MTGCFRYRQDRNRVILLPVALCLLRAGTALATAGLLIADDPFARDRAALTGHIGSLIPEVYAGFKIVSCFQVASLAQISAARVQNARNSVSVCWCDFTAVVPCVVRTDIYPRWLQRSFRWCGLSCRPLISPRAQAIRHQSAYWIGGCFIASLAANTIFAMRLIGPRTRI